MSARGSELESLLNNVHAVYRNQGRAVIDKIEVPRLPNGLPRTKSTVDYTGCLKGGTFIAVEAKSVHKGKRWQLRNIHQHQLDYLISVSKAGGDARIVLWFQEPDIAFKLDPKWVDHEKHIGTKSLSIDELDYVAEWLADRIPKFPDYLG